MRRRMLMGKKEPITVTLYGADNDTITISEGNTTLQSVTLSGASGQATIANGEGTYTFKSANTSYSTTVAVKNGSSVNVGTTYTISITLNGEKTDTITISRAGWKSISKYMSSRNGSISLTIIGQSSATFTFYSNNAKSSVTATVSNGSSVSLPLSFNPSYSGNATINRSASYRSTHGYFCGYNALGSTGDADYFSYFGVKVNLDDIWSDIQKAPTYGFTKLSVHAALTGNIGYYSDYEIYDYDGNYHSGNFSKDYTFSLSELSEYDDLQIIDITGTIEITSGGSTHYCFKAPYGTYSASVNCSVGFS